jgi:hypothetical protein
VVSFITLPKLKRAQTWPTHHFLCPMDQQICQVSKIETTFAWKSYPNKRKAKTLLSMVSPRKCLTIVFASRISDLCQSWVPKVWILVMVYSASHPWIMESMLSCRSWRPLG